MQIAKLWCRFVVNYVVILSAIFVFSSISWAIGNRLYGPEFEFTTDYLNNIMHPHGSLNREKEQQQAEALSNHLKARCKEIPGCRAEKVDGKWGEEWRFHLYWTHHGMERSTFLQVSWDPKVVEVLMEPMIIPHMKEAESLIQDFLFNSASAVGLKPSFDLAGHISIGVQAAFHNDPDLFLRFYVDHSNHPEWDLGVFGKDIHNAPPLAVLPESQSFALQAIIHEFAAGRHRSVQKLAGQIQRRVHKATSTWNERSGAGHYQAQSVKTISGISTWGGLLVLYPRKDLDKQRLELRGSYGQESYLQFIRYAEFIDARIEMLKRERTAGIPIVFKPTRRRHFSVEDLVHLYHQELDRMNLDRETYSILLHPDIRPSYLKRCSSIYQ